MFPFLIVEDICLGQKKWASQNVRDLQCIKPKMLKKHGVIAYFVHIVRMIRHRTTQQQERNHMNG